MKNTRITRFHIREVTGHLPEMPGQVIATLETGEDCVKPHPYQKGRWFYVEIHAANFGWFGPVALGIVATDDDETGATMVSMWVLDYVRGDGYGRQLIESAGKRWPDLKWTHCEQSLPFHERLVQQGIARKRSQSHFYDFIPHDQR